MARLQLDLSDTYDALLEKLQPLCDLRTKKDVVENALLLLGWAAAEASQGLKIAAIDESKNVFKEVHTPALEGARNSERRRAKWKEDLVPAVEGVRERVAAALRWTWPRPESRLALDSERRRAVEAIERSGEALGRAAKAIERVSIEEERTAAVPTLEGAGDIERRQVVEAVERAVEALEQFEERAAAAPASARASLR